MTKTKKILESFLPYTLLIIFLILITIAAQFFLEGNSFFHEDLDFQVFVLASLLFVGYFINRLAPKTVIPSFVWAIFAGIALQPILVVYTEDISVLKVAIEVCAAIVLFAGGLEIPFKNFKKWFFPIASLSFIGVLVSAVIFSFAIYFLLKIFGGYDLSLLPSIIILSAALASTDPTAIIPTLESLRFKRGFLKQIAISESALTDISGSIITRFLLLAFVGIHLTQDSNILGLFKPLFQKSAYDALALQIITGVLIGYLGFVLVKKFYYNTDDNTDRKTDGKQQADPALLLSVPIFTFVLGNIIAGAGFLAAFVSGLLSDVVGNLKKASHFYDSLLNHLIKPFIFIFLGALVPLDVLLELAPLGILSALLFMFVIRPVVVFISLMPWFIKGEFKFQDLLFLSFIRETGIIAAVLIIIASTYNIIQSDFIVAIGMWVILFTLILEPPLTPYVAKFIGVAEMKQKG